MVSTSPPLPPPPTKHFHRFPDLPSELRLKIYDFILAVPIPPKASYPEGYQSLPETEHKRHILKIAYLPVQRYVSNTAPTPLLSMWSESRIYAQTVRQYTNLLLGPELAVIPISFPITTVYITSLMPILASPPASSVLYTLSTTPSRHKIESIALDMRVWSSLCHEGLIGVLAKMKRLQEVWLVVEFGRREFIGEVGFLSVPDWRGDLKWVADRAGDRIVDEKRKLKALGGRTMDNSSSLIDEKVKVGVVLLTRGGEQA